MISHVMPDHVSGVLAGSSHCFVMDPHPPSSSSASVGAFTWPSAFIAHVSPSQLWASGKCLNISCSPPAKPRRGCPASTPATAAASPGPAAAVRSKSSLTQLLREFASNSATSGLPLLRSADTQPAPWPLPLTFTLSTPILVRL
ncbi:hypothetical protein CRENBAI_001230 [Crenichthys baileyi]|uniref:Uncharacterized protein n=1 Tax=Crenichthys baileyi TaxID=28760 RepID=A0AAV9SML6_9TELE